MATSGSHRAQPFGGLGRRERRRTKRDPGERCQGAAARATPCVAGVPPISGTHRPQGRLLHHKPLDRTLGELSHSDVSVPALVQFVAQFLVSVDEGVEQFTVNLVLIVWLLFVLGLSLRSKLLSPIMRYRKAVDNSVPLVSELAKQFQDSFVLFIQDFSPLAAQRPALNHPLRGWRQTALQSHPSDRY